MSLAEQLIQDYVDSQGDLDEVRGPMGGTIPGASKNIKKVRDALKSAGVKGKPWASTSDIVFVDTDDVAGVAKALKPELKGEAVVKPFNLGKGKKAVQVKFRLKPMSQF